MNRWKAEYNALYGDQAAFGGGSGNNGVGHANGSGTVSSNDSGSDSHSGGSGGARPENGSSGGISRTGDGADELTASQVCTFASLRLQTQVMRISTCCGAYMLGKKTSTAIGPADALSVFSHPLAG